jgi:hypothetical protein
VSTVTINVTPQTQGFPVSPPPPIPGDWRFMLLDPALTPVAQETTPNTSVTFTNIPPGNYTASCARLDTLGNVMGSITTSYFEIESQDVELEVAGTLSVTVTP